MLPEAFTEMWGLQKWIKNGTKGMDSSLEGGEGRSRGVLALKGARRSVACGREAWVEENVFGASAGWTHTAAHRGACAWGVDVWEPAILFHAASHVFSIWNASPFLVIGAESCAFLCS